MSEPDTNPTKFGGFEIAISMMFAGVVAAIPNQIIWMRGQEVLIDFLGVIYGVAIAAVLVILLAQPIWKMLVLVVAAGLSWVAALYTALFLIDTAAESIVFAVATGCAAGAIGAGILAIAFALIYPRFARLQAIWRTVGIGAIAGLLLLPSIQTPLFLFMLFQGSVSFSLGMDRRVFD